jgi:hypothetical protein
MMEKSKKTLLWIITHHRENPLDFIYSSPCITEIKSRKLGRLDMGEKEF